MSHNSFVKIQIENKPLSPNPIYPAALPDAKCYHRAGPRIASASAHRLSKETAQSDPTQMLISELIKEAVPTAPAPVHSRCAGNSDFPSALSQCLGPCQQEPSAGMKEHLNFQIYFQP